MGLREFGNLIVPVAAVARPPVYERKTRRSRTRNLERDLAAVARVRSGLCLHSFAGKEGGDGMRIAQAGGHGKSVHCPSSPRGEGWTGCHPRLFPNSAFASTYVRIQRRPSQRRRRTQRDWRGEPALSAEVAVGPERLWKVPNEPTSQSDVPRSRDEDRPHRPHPLTTPSQTEILATASCPAMPRTHPAPTRVRRGRKLSSCQNFGGKSDASPRTSDSCQAARIA